MQNYFMECLHGTILFINVVHVVIIVIYEVRLQKIEKQREQTCNP